MSAEYKKIDDELYGDAVEFVRRSGVVRGVDLRTEFKIGSVRVDRLLSAMAANGLVVPPVTPRGVWKWIDATDEAEASASSADSVPDPNDATVDESDQTASDSPLACVGEAEGFKIYRSREVFGTDDELVDVLEIGRAAGLSRPENILQTADSVLGDFGNDSGVFCRWQEAGAISARGGRPGRRLYANSVGYGLITQRLRVPGAKPMQLLQARLFAAAAKLRDKGAGDVLREIREDRAEAAKRHLELLGQTQKTNENLTALINHIITTGESADLANADAMIAVRRDIGIVARGRLLLARAENRASSDVDESARIQEDLRREFGASVDAERWHLQIYAAVVKRIYGWKNDVANAVQTKRTNVNAGVFIGFDAGSNNGLAAVIDGRLWETMRGGSRSSKAAFLRRCLQRGAESGHRLAVVAIEDFSKDSGDLEDAEANIIASVRGFRAALSDVGENLFVVCTVRPADWRRVLCIFAMGRKEYKAATAAAIGRIHPVGDLTHDVIDAIAIAQWAAVSRTVQVEIAAAKAEAASRAADELKGAN